MVPRVAAKGRSFKGAGLYYLHDKKADTSARVAFTLTENLPTEDPELALRFMAYTAMRQDQLKAANDGARTGRKLTKPVYTYSLSWAPDEAPTQAEMIEAGRETLKVLGLDAHEVLMVAHNDEPHPHLHLIVNRVHPETGRAATLSKDHLELSKWAEEYERQQGQIRCEQRVANNNERRRRKARGQNGFVKHDQKMNAAEYRRWQQLGKDWDENSALTPALTMNVSAYHRQQRQKLFDHKEMRIEQRRAALREQNRPLWRTLYKLQEMDRKDLQLSQRSAYTRLLHWIRHRNELPKRTGWLRGALEAVLGRHDFAKTLEKQHAEKRRELIEHAGRQTREIFRQENEIYRRELEMLQRDQAQETAHLRDVQQAEAEALRPDPREAEFRREEAARRQQDAAAKPVKDQFKERVGKRIRKARKKRDDRGKGQGREREE